MIFGALLSDNMSCSPQSENFQYVRSLSKSCSGDKYCSRSKGQSTDWKEYTLSSTIRTGGCGGDRRWGWPVSSTCLDEEIGCSWSQTCESEP